MHARHSRWWTGLLVAAALAGCNGGRGSSGFDVNSENEAISRALASRECVDFQGLTICPANAEITPTPSPSATPPPSTTPSGLTPSPTPTRGTPTGTATPGGTPNIETTLGDATAIDCTQYAPGGSCAYTLTFTPHSFLPGTGFRVLARAVAPNGAWMLGTDPTASDDASDPTLQATLALTSTQGGPPAHVQFAILAFAGAAPTAPGQFTELRQTNAAFAFVTQMLVVNVVTAYPPLDAAPQISFFGLARADDVVLTPSTFDGSGRPIYIRASGDGIAVVVEARPGTTGVAVGTNAFSSSGGLPDLQIVVSRPLGNGISTGCDKAAGGVPAVDPPVFSSAPDIVDAINDLGCHVDDGAGNPTGRGVADACTIPNAVSAEYAFVNKASTVQFCLPIAQPWAFPSGDTVLAARVDDLHGQVSAPQEIVVRVQAPVSVATATRSPTPAGPRATGTATVATRPTGATATATAATPPTLAGATRTPAQPAASPTPSQTPTTTPPPPDVGPSITYMGLARSDDVVMSSTATDAFGRPVFVSHDNGVTLVVEARPGTLHFAVGLATFDPSGGLPDLQILVSAQLGDGSPEVCDKTLPHPGGVPATDPPVFSDAPAVTNAINDLGCRADDGTGQPLGRSLSFSACTIPNGVTGEYTFVHPESSAQYCVPIDRPWRFAPGDTIVAARVRDTGGTVGQPKEIVVRIVQPSETATPGATP